MASVVCLYSSIQEDDILEHIDRKCHLFTLKSNCNICKHLVTLLNILMPGY